MLTLLLSAALLAGPPEPHACPSGETWSVRATEWACRPDLEVHPRIVKPLKWWETALPLGTTIVPMVITDIGISSNSSHEGNPAMHWLYHKTGTGGMYAARAAVGGLMSYAAHRSQKRWLVYGWSGLMLAETGWDLKVAFSW